MSESHQLNTIIAPQPTLPESGRDFSGSLYPNVPPTYESNNPQYSPKPPSLTPSNGQSNSSDWTRNASIQLPNALDRGTLTRTPSPTPSERKALNSKTRLIEWESMERMRTREFWMRKKILIRGVAIIVAVALVVVFVVFHKRIVTGLTPAGQWLRSHPGGWLVPVAILMIMSFPPLFGHEIIGLLCGVIWGLGEGFGIVALGTLLGEIANYYTFKYCCSARGNKYENRNMKYSCLARVIRDGGFKVALIVRYSLIPPHFTTAIFSTVGMGIGVFVAAAVLSLPKQLVTVYLGTIFEESVNTSSKKDKIISAVILIVAGIITIASARYISKRIDEIKPQVIYERRKVRQSKGLKSTSSSAVGDLV